MLFISHMLPALIKNKFFQACLIMLMALFSLAAPLHAAGVAEYIEAKKAPDMDLTKWMTGGPNFLGVLQVVGWGFIDEAWGMSESAITNGQTQGAIPVLFSFMGATYLQKPASVPQYLAYVQNKSGFPVKPAYAQGKGFEAMRPILPIWELMRNIVYLFFVVVFVAIGFMIMFRKKLDPQTVISIQSALPMIIVSLILVTFSYAISGLIIDISELATRVIAAVFRADYFHNINDVIDRLTDPTICSGSPSDCMYNFFKVSAVLFQTKGISEAIQQTISTIAEGLGTGTGGAWLLRGVSGVVVTLIFTIAMLQTLMKGFFMLLTAYVNIVLSTIFSPFVFLANSFSPGAAGQWFKGFLTNVLVFPVTFLLLMLAALMIAGTTTSSTVSTEVKKEVNTIWDVNITGGITSFNWYPAPLGIFWRLKPGADPKLSTSYEFDTDLINYLVAFGMLLAIPRVNDLIKGAFERREAGVGEGVSQTLMGAMRNVPVIGGILSG